MHSKADVKTAEYKEVAMPFINQYLGVVVFILFIYLLNRSNLCGGKRKRSRDGRGEDEEPHCVTPMDMEGESPASRGR